MRMIALSAFMPVLFLCQFSCSQMCLPSIAKGSQSVEIPGTTEGVKIKMQPQFQEVNDKFRRIYAETRTRTIKKSQPIIVAIDEKLVLHDGPRHESTQVITDKFTLLKSIDHIVLATFVILELDTDQMLGDVKLQQLHDFESAAGKALASLDKCGLKGEVLERQKQLIDMALTLLHTTIKEKRISSDVLNDYCRNSRKMVMQNVDEAIADQLLAVNTQVKQWRKELGPEKWDALNVVIVSGHMPRERNSNMQYFAKLFKQKREGLRLFYCEGLSEESDALNLVGTHILDRKIAVAFFKDEWRMHRDLLGDGAAKYLSEHPPLK